MAFKKIMGQNFRVFVGNKAVNEAVSCSVTISGNMEDASTKDSENSFTEEQMTSKSWQVQVDSVDSSVEKIKTLLKRIKDGNPVSVGFDQTTKEAGTYNRKAANAKFARSGQAIMTDLSIQANNRTTISVSEQYLGTGALA